MKERSLAAGVARAKERRHGNAVEGEDVSGERTQEALCQWQRSPKTREGHDAEATVSHAQRHEWSKIGEDVEALTGRQFFTL